MSLFVLSVVYRATKHKMYMLFPTQSVKLPVNRELQCLCTHSIQLPATAFFSPIVSNIPLFIHPKPNHLLYYSVEIPLIIATILTRGTHQITIVRIEFNIDAFKSIHIINISRAHHSIIGFNGLYSFNVCCCFCFYLSLRWSVSCA